jgi:hypothetical protein
MIALLSSLLLMLPVCAARAQEAGTPEHVDTNSGERPEDVLVFKDGDRLTGQMERAERGVVIFRTNKLGEVRVSFSEIKQLICVDQFAVLKQGVRVTKANAIIGRLEVENDKVIVIPLSGPHVELSEYDVAYAIDDKTFEHEVSRKAYFHEGWTATASLGASVVRGSNDSVEINSNLYMTRTLPGVDYLPRRNRTSLSIRDTYNVTKRADYYNDGATVDDHSHIFNADLERNEYIREHFYILGSYSFYRNYASGLLAQHVLGAGVGYTLINNYVQQLDLKTDFNRNAQYFNDYTTNDILWGQKLAADYRRELPGNITAQIMVDYTPSYNLPHKYQANGNAIVTLPVYRNIGISFTTTDGYLNNPSYGSKRNTFQFSTNLSYSFR